MSSNCCSYGNLAELEEYQDMKKCLKTIQNTDVIKKVGVALSELESCDKNCLKCIRYYSIDIDHYATSCADEIDIEFILCVRDNLPDPKIEIYLKIMVPIVLVVLLILIISFWYCKYIKRKRSKRG